MTDRRKRDVVPLHQRQPHFRMPSVEAPVPFGGSDRCYEDDDCAMYACPRCYERRIASECVCGETGARNCPVHQNEESR